MSDFAPDFPDDFGVTVASGVPIPILWERHGRVVSFVFAPRETR